ncbi:C-type lectin-like [Pelodiscus sinensis]|uniref:C-type lectin-like n=1 Tax=Pelodiscus sinensis TaxID=13735 RepID=UPI003F6B0F40
MGPVAFVTLCLLGCLVCSPALAGARATACPSGWESYLGHCYGYFTQEKSWDEAEAECQEHGEEIHLVSILTDGESTKLAGYVKQQQAKTEPVWIGLSDPEHNRSWRWADGSLAKFSAWNRGQPDPPTRNEHCVVLERPDFKKWDDYPCDRKFPFVCKQSAGGRNRVPPAERVGSLQRP